MEPQNYVVKIKLREPFTQYTVTAVDAFHAQTLALEAIFKDNSPAVILECTVSEEKADAPKPKGYAQ